MKDKLLLTGKEIGEIFTKEGWSCLEECDVRVIAKAQLAKAKPIIEKRCFDNFNEAITEAKREERERIIEFLRKHWIGYDTEEAPKWVYLRFGGTQKDWEDFIGTPTKKVEEIKCTQS